MCVVEILNYDGVVLLGVDVHDDGFNGWLALDECAFLVFHFSGVEARKMGGIPLIALGMLTGGRWESFIWERLNFRKSKWMWCDAVVDEMSQSDGFGSGGL